MHDAVTTPELLLLTFQSDALTRLDLLHAALTCRVWTAWALDVLWGKHEVPFRSIIELLGPLELTSRSKCFFHTWDKTFEDFSKADWSRFLRYTERITSARLHTFALDPPVIYLIERLALSYGGPIFPALRSVSFSPCLNMALTAGLLLVPTLKAVSLRRVGDDLPDPIAAKIMRMFETTLQEVNSEKTELSFTVDDFVEPRFSCYPKLRRLSVNLLGWRTELPPSLFYNVADLKDLVSLEITAQPCNVDPVLSRTVNFPSLRRLSLGGAATLAYGTLYITAAELEDLSLERTFMDESEIEGLLPQLKPRFPNLNRFLYETNNEIGISTIRLIIATFPKLRHLTVCSPALPSDDRTFTTELVPVLHKLSTLHFQGYTTWGGRTAPSMAISPWSLAALFGKAPQITDLWIGLGHFGKTVGGQAPVVTQLDSLAIDMPYELAEDVDGWDTLAATLAPSLPGLRTLQVTFNTATYSWDIEELRYAEKRSKEAVSKFWMHQEALWKRSPGWNVLSP